MRICKKCGGWVELADMRDPHYIGCRCPIVKPTQGHIGTDDFGAWTCVCGNTEHRQGFHPWNRETKAYDANEPRFFRCNRCERIIDTDPIAGLVSQV